VLSIIVPEIGVDVNDTAALEIAALDTAALEIAALDTAVLAGALTILAAITFCPEPCNVLPCELSGTGI
jgi:hypothetical protein